MSVSPEIPCEANLLWHSDEDKIEDISGISVVLEMCFCPELNTDNGAGSEVHVVSLTVQHVLVSSGVVELIDGAPVLVSGESLRDGLEAPSTLEVTASADCVGPIFVSVAGSASE